jgi:hypothetical protein
MLFHMGNRGDDDGARHGEGPKVPIRSPTLESLANLTSSIMSGYAGFVHQGGGDQEGLGKLRLQVLGVSLSDALSCRRRRRQA